MFGWYFTRIYVHVRPERVYVWRDGDVAREPELFDAHMEEVRSGHDEEPDDEHAPTRGGASRRGTSGSTSSGERYPEAVVSLVAPGRLPLLGAASDLAWTGTRGGSGWAARRWACPGSPGLACVTAHDHAPDFTWQRNFQVRGDLVEEDGAWAVIPQRLVGGFELPPASNLERYRLNARKVLRFRKIARAEMRKRAAAEGLFSATSGIAVTVPP